LRELLLDDGLKYSRRTGVRCRDGCRCRPVRRGRRKPRCRRRVEGQCEITGGHQQATAQPDGGQVAYLPTWPGSYPRHWKFHGLWAGKLTASASKLSRRSRRRVQLDQICPMGPVRDNMPYPWRGVPEIDYCGILSRYFQVTEGHGRLIGCSYVGALWEIPRALLRAWD
jgi:hypothetical protein